MPASRRPGAQENAARQSTSDHALPPEALGQNAPGLVVKDNPGSLFAPG